MTFSELPDDVVIVQNDGGQYEAKSSERSVPRMRWATEESARLECLTYLNAWAAIEHVSALLRDTKPYRAGRYSREQYERACAELGVMRLPDSVCKSLAAGRFDASEHDAETIVIGLLATDRRAGMLAEERQQRKDFEADLGHLSGFRSRGLSREQYEKTCAWIDTEPAAEEQITDLKVKCFQQEEIADLVDLPLILAKWRATGQHHERQAGA